MTYTRHGHHIPASPRDDERGQIEKILCGGLALCTDCQSDANITLSGNPDYDPPAYSESDEKPDIFLDRAKLFVVGSWNNQVEDPDWQFGVSDLRIVWFSKTLQNWKALVICVKPGTELYFEVSHNGDKQETYVDTYLKINNDKFSQEGL